MQYKKGYNRLLVGDFYYFGEEDRLQYLTQTTRHGQEVGD